MRACLSILCCAGLIGLSNITLRADDFYEARTAIADQLPEIAIASLKEQLAQNKFSPSELEQGRSLLLEAYVRASKFAEALALSTDVKDELSRNYWTGYAQAGLGETAQAFASWEKIDDTSPYFATSLRNRIELYLLTGQALAAKSLLNKITKDKPSLSKDFPISLKARIALESGEHSKAIQLLEAQDKLTPQNLYLLAKSQLRAGKLEEALASSDQALTKKPSSSLQTLLRLLKADLYQMQNLKPQALEELIQIFKLPDFATLIPAIRQRLAALSDNQLIHQSIASYLSRETLGQKSNELTEAKLQALFIYAEFAPKEEALEALEQIIHLAPDEAIADQSKLAKARILLENNEQDAAQELLQSVSERKTAPFAQQATELLARLAYAADNHSKARDLFQQVVEQADSSLGETALMNAALSSIAVNPENPLSYVLKSEDLQATLTLEKALSLTKTNPAKAQTQLEAFLAKPIAHPRAADAKVALASLLINAAIPDFDRIRTLLNEVRPVANEQSLSRRLFLTEHQLAAITSEWDAAVQAAVKHRQNYPESKKDTLFTLKYAEALYYKKDFSKAATLFNKAAEIAGSGPLRDMGLLYAAKSNLEIPTANSTESALLILEQLIEERGPRAIHARILKASTLLNKMGRAQDALDALGNLSDQTGESKDAALIAAEAHRELGPTDASHYREAIRIYENLLTDPNTSYADSNRIHYRLARTYRESGDLPRALDACWRVINFVNHPAGDTLPAWTYYYRCGFEAIDILEEARRYSAALALAKKLAETEGPGAAEAAERASQLELEHLLWQD